MCGKQSTRDYWRCYFPHVETKRVFTFQPIKRLASTTVKSAKPAAAFWIFFLRTKNRQLCCLAKTEHIVLQERRVMTTRNHLHFEKISPPITTKHTRTWTKKGWNESKYGINVSVSYWLMIWTTYSIFKSFYSISIYSQPVLNLHKIIVIFSVSNDGIHWTLDFGHDSVTIAVNDLDQNITISSQEIPPSSLAIVVDSKTGLFEQPSSASTNHS